MAHQASQRELLLTSFMEACRYPSRVWPQPAQSGADDHQAAVIRGHSEPAVIAICGIGPVNFALSDPSKPAWREV
jgi:hypothetical protein